MDEIKKPIKKVDNSSYQERFQFQLQVNDNIICQRYFKIPLFNSVSLISEELTNALRGVVETIKRDLESKSRIYLAYAFDNKTKLTGFATKQEAYKQAKENNATPSEIRKILLRTEEDETSITWPQKEWDETEFVNYGDVTFKFSFIVDDRVVFTEIWDGSQYPKYVRNCVDLTNSKSIYPMVQLMNSGKPDLVVDIINKICDVCSNKDVENNRQYTKTMKYGVDEIFARVSGINTNTVKKYSYSPAERKYTPNTQKKNS